MLFLRYLLNLNFKYIMIRVQSKQNIDHPLLVRMMILVKAEGFINGNMQYPAITTPKYAESNDTIAAQAS
ncbi:hypothetical protein FGO68_gene9567 [Halteria grandinella]|uniref:Uncharacterized protein n=1 Tax=Halteria grandinella TaxID=5974 RepID=A0A8J8NB62_HALGN|nr:hypothetical protein FGO68_gene9567 [Halteria grandinella]